MLSIHFKKCTIQFAPSRLRKSYQKNKIFKVLASQNKNLGSSMIELLIATVVALFAASAAAQIINNLNNSGFNRRAGATSAIDVAINNDLIWFQQYAQYWRLLKGPYLSLPIEITKNQSYTPIQNSNESKTYAPNDPSECVGNNMAISFLQDAASSSTYTSPINNPPNPISASGSLQNITLPNVASDYVLARQIQPGAVTGTLRITYTLTKFGALQFRKNSSVYLPASGWCS